MENQTDGVQNNADGAQQENNEQPDSSVNKTVSWENHQRAIDDMHKYKRTSKEKDEVIAKLQQQIGNTEDEKLRENEQWKQLAEKREAEALAAKEEAERSRKAFIESQKFGAVKNAAAAAGMIDLGDLEMLDLGDVETELTSNGRIIINGHDKFIERLKETRPHWFRKKQAPTINGGGGSGDSVASPSGPLTPQDVVKAERDAKMGRITQSEYHSIFNKYVEQKQQLSKG